MTTIAVAALRAATAAAVVATAAVTAEAAMAAEAVTKVAAATAEAAAVAVVVTEAAAVAATTKVAAAAMAAVTRAVAAAATEVAATAAAAMVAEATTAATKTVVTKQRFSCTRKYLLMTSAATDPKDYLDSLPPERKEAMTKLRDVIAGKLPNGFEEVMNYGMLGFVVPHSRYPQGYHCDPKQPLPFVNLASQKNAISLYHMGLYAMPDLLQWFQDEYPKHSKGKLDMGKSCIRFKKPEEIPFGLIGELMKKMSPEEWISCYESTFRNARKGK